jgi:hypothetical protein
MLGGDMVQIRDAYVQYLIVSPLNQTQTYMGEHHMGLSHDQVNRFMRGQKLRPRHVWQAVRGDVVASDAGYLLFDDTVISKEHSEKIEMAQVQYSGTAHGLVLGISVVNCVYYNPETNQFWVIDYRIYDPKTDGRDKLQHMEDMLRHTVAWKKLPFRGVLMDTWYATNHLMQVIDSLGKYFYCPIKVNRSVHQGVHWTQPQYLDWDADALKHGHAVRLKKLAKAVNVRLHRQATVTGTDGVTHTYLITNDIHVPFSVPGFAGKWRNCTGKPSNLRLWNGASAARPAPSGTISRAQTSHGSSSNAPLMPSRRPFINLKKNCSVIISLKR